VARRREGSCRPGRSAALGVALALLTAGSSTGTPALDPFDVVVLDAGHGGYDDGATGPRGTREKDVVLDVARELARELRARGITVVMTRSEDVFVPLEERTHIANDARGDLFVSIHANAAADGRIHGTETFFLSLDASDDAARRLAERENRAFGEAAAAQPIAADPLVAILGDLIATEHLSASQEFAGLAEERLGRRDSTSSRGVKQAPFVVLAGVQMPASLVEIGFITNRRDERTLAAGAGRRSIIEALVEAIGVYRGRHDVRRGIRSSPARGAP